MKQDNAPQILVIDDEKGVRNLLSTMLARLGHKVTAVGTAEAGLNRIQAKAWDLVITDLRLPGMPGQALVAQLGKSHPTLPVIVVSAYGGTREVVDVVKQGAVDYLAKPFLDSDLELAVAKALRQKALLRENERLRQETGLTGQPEEGLVGRSPAMRKLLLSLQRIALGKGSVLLRGDSGTGKELAARAIHARSPRREGPFVEVNAGAIPSNLFEAELFGSKRGAYTGSEDDRLGLFRSADGGTLFLDEVGEIPLALQAKLLRVLETGEVRPVGENRPRPVDVRVVSATNQDLEAMVANGSFRKDLYFRLSVLPLRLPNLSERREDIPALAEHLLRRIAGDAKPATMSAEAARGLMSRPWPGNVRELRNVLERAALFSLDGEIQASDLVFDGGQPALRAPATPLRLAKSQAAEAFERQYLIEALRASGGNVSRAARSAGVDRRNFHTLMRRHQLKGGTKAV
jgi:DNA-binding NtrC family response regulator